MSTPTPTHLPPIIKGDSDYRTYRPLLLDNGITVLLAHDPQAKHFAASVSVHAGASCDPRFLPGLAHFTEHMCFLGSEVYPMENEYKQYLAKHGGKSNASTSMSHTTYQFDVLAEHGEKALDIFSNFFICPLFSKSGTQREVNAVDSENSKNLVDDGRRRWQILKSFADPQHHFSKFSTGNRITLPASSSENAGVSSDHPLNDILEGINDGAHDENDAAEFVRAALLAFHKRHYTPNKMTAVLVGPQSLDELESWAVPRFGRIPDRWNSDDNGKGKDETNNDDDDSLENGEKWRKMQLAAARLIDESASDAPPVSIEAAESVTYNSAFRPDLHGGQWPVVVTTKPIKDIRKLVLYFPLPPTWRSPDRSPTQALSHLFGHEGTGSAFALLQDKGWITSLSTGNRVHEPDQCLFKVEMTLTPEGEEHWAEATGAIFAYAKMVQSAAEESLANCHDGENQFRRIWDEVASLSKIRFHQTSPGAVYSFAPSVAKSISVNGTETCLSTGSMLNENSDSLPLKEMLDFVRQMHPNNCFIERCSHKAWEDVTALYEGKTSNLQNDTFEFGPQIEKWYGVDYYVSPVDQKHISPWKASDDEEMAFHLPKPNRYIPRTLGLSEDLPEEAKVQRIDKAIDPPKLIVNKPSGRLWWRLDDRYALPKASLTLLFRTATAENKFTPPLGWEYDTGAAMKSSLITKIFAEALAQETYDASLAGLGWSLSKSSSGFSLSCGGYSDRLPELAVKLLTDFCNLDGVMNPSHFISSKDKTVRSLKSYLASSRADSVALYYRNLLLSSQGKGVEANLEVAESLTFEDIVGQHRRIWADTGMVMEVFYTGNVSKEEAETFFVKSMDVIERTQAKALQDHTQNSCPVPPASASVPGPFERRLPAGEDLELHFASKNPQDENGAVVVSYQSQNPGFKGKSLSSEECLQHSAAIRLICKMIREPAFNELRTKQQLGYIVGSYYDMNYSSYQPYFSQPACAVDVNNAPKPIPITTSIDSLVMYVVSRKESPVEVANRIDDFVLNFRSRLEDMSPSEIEEYADSLAKALTEPIRKLGDEAMNHFGKIRRYAPETLIDGSGYSAEDIPWDNAEVLAGALRKLDRDAIIRVYDSLVVKKESRSKITSFVYGNTFPLDLRAGGKPLPGKYVASSIEELMSKRKTLIAYDSSLGYPKKHVGSSLYNMLRTNKSVKYAVIASAVVGVGILGTVAIQDKGGDNKKQK